ncbi:hypothetical protein CB0940_00280 [Cercospora beticola]|uniref:Uncharacterized protein n=1 Tax=Cercospora beticola TaxID=122368 RepID=A0A2G5I751_CERBT|nr:hypothetical protein CB0940_00280 [Cercospora beticola]PIB00562.1 hypothetical protein CB0940_00280 [Cercospora beticola]
MKPSRPHPFTADIQTRHSYEQDRTTHYHDNHEGRNRNRRIGPRRRRLGQTTRHRKDTHSRMHNQDQSRRQSRNALPRHLGLRRQRIRRLLQPQPTPLIHTGQRPSDQRLGRRPARYVCRRQEEIDDSAGIWVWRSGNWSDSWWSDVDFRDGVGDDQRKRRRTGRSERRAMSKMTRKREV